MTLRSGTALIERNKKFFLVFLPIVLGLYLRILVWPIESNDFKYFLSRWHEFVKLRGFAAFQHDFYDYTPAYIYLLWFSSYLPVPAIYCVKLISLTFELLLCTVVRRFLFLNSILRSRANAGFLICWFGPTVVLNGQVWGQCDIVPSFFGACTMFYLFKRQFFNATLVFSIGLSFKLQLIFVFPALLVALLKVPKKLPYLFCAPVVYALICLPTYFAGRTIESLATIYFRQASQYNELNYNSPNLFAFFPTNADKSLYLMGLITSSVITIFYIIRFYRGFTLDYLTKPPVLISMFLIFSLLEPLTLPRMHERYFFQADVFALLYLCISPNRFYVSFLVVLASSFSYFPYLFNLTILNLSFLALFNISALGLLHYFTFIDQNDRECT